MSLFDDASLAMIPSAYKDGKLYSIKPTDGSGDFTFSRGSNLAATRVDENGLIEKGRENLLLQSNSFSTSPWAGSGISLSSGFAGYDGTNNAWELTRSASPYSRLNYLISQSGIYTHSIYAKAGTLNWISVGPSGGSEGTWFNLTTGEQGEQGSSIIHSSIQSAGNGWWRISVIINNPSNQYFRLYPANVDGGDDSTTAGTIYIQDAQLEVGLVATDYIETTTTTAQAGILEDMPRLDYSGGASCPSLLLEPQRTNLVTYSEYFGASDWIKSRSVVSANTTISPSGIQDAATITENTFTNNFSGLEGNIAVVNGTTYTQSIFVKKGNIDFFAVGYFIVGGANGIVIYNLNTKLVTLSSNITSSSITDFANGWVRISITYTANASSLNYFGYFHTKDSGTTYYDGDGTGFTHVWGAQLEQGSYPTSYIPTYGTSQTRSQDTYQKDGFGNTSTAGTLFYEFSNYQSPASANGMYMVALFVGSSVGDAFFPQANSISIINNGLAIEGRNNGFATTLFSFTPAINATVKVALRYDGTNVVGFVNGVKQTEFADTAVGVKNAIRVNNGENAKQATKQLAYFPTALTDSECIALTS